tara:strand:+ start:51 stop:260 length:210 start_codon:yes stop_codon:yes gene_type:complete
MSEDVKFLSEWERMSRLTFTSDYEKMRDFFQITKEDFLKSYSYMTEQEYDATSLFVQRYGLKLEDMPNV